MQNIHVEAVNVFMEEFGVDDMMCKVNAMHRITTVIAVLDSSHIANHLIPFLESKIWAKCSFGVERG